MASEQVKPCPQGHLERSKATGKCLVCQRIASKDNPKKTRDIEQPKPNMRVFIMGKEVK